MIKEEFLGSDKLDSTILNILLKNEEVYGKFEAVVKEKWIKSANEEKEKLEAAIKSLNTENEKAEKLRKDKELAIGELEKKERSLKENNEALSTVTKKIVNDFNSEISNRVADSVLINAINGDKSSTTESSDYEIIRYGDSADVKSTDETALAERLLCNNIKSQGFDSVLATLISKYTFINNNYLHHYVISGVASKLFADAISNSIDGKNATVIDVYSSKVNIQKLLCDLDQVETQVILICGVLDNCVENLYFTMCKRYSDKILVFSLDALENISILSKDIWAYSLLINADVYYSIHASGNSNLMHQIIDLKKLQTDSAPSKEFLMPMVKESFVKCGLSFVAIDKILQALAYVESLNMIEEDKLKDLISSVLIRFLIAYKNGMSDVAFEQLIGLISTNIRKLYLI